MRRGRVNRGPGRRDGSAAAGFSLLEILLVLMLFGLIGALLVGGGSRLQATLDKDTETAALNAIAATRHAAVLAGRTLELTLDGETRRLDWGVAGAELPGEDEIHLLPPVTTSAVLIGGRRQEAPLARVRFYPDGTCDPFRLEVVPAGNRRESRIIVLDPWTCTALTPAKTTR